MDHFIKFDNNSNKEKQPINYDNEYSYKFVKGRDCDIDCIKSEDNDNVIDIDEGSIDKYLTFNP